MCPHRGKRWCTLRFNPSGEGCTRAHPDGRDALSAGHLPRDLLAAGRPAAGVPRPRIHPAAIASGRARATGKGHATSQGIGEFDGVRAYRRGDPQTQARGLEKAAKSLGSGADDLVSRDAQQSHRQELWLDVAHAQLPDLEARISRVTAWVLQADRWAWTTACVPGREIPANGAAHRVQCLEALALC